MTRPARQTAALKRTFDLARLEWTLRGWQAWHWKLDGAGAVRRASISTGGPSPRRGSP